MFMLNGKLLDEAFPINKVEVFFDSLDHSNFLGFTWELVSQGKMPIGLNSNDSDFNTIGNTGGGKTISYTPQGSNTGGKVQSHTLTIDEIPSHSHTFSVSYWDGWDYSDGERHNVRNSNKTENTGTTGGGQGHSHDFTQPTFTGTTATLDKMPPYIVMAFWKRIA